MSVKLVSGESFSASYDGMRQLTVIVGSGGATLRALAGSTEVDVTDGNITADGIITFHAVKGQSFVVNLTGTAQAWLAG